MNTMRRNKRLLYLSKRDNESDYERYLEPIEKYYSYKNVSGEKVIENTGEIVGGYITITDINEKLEDINIGDKLCKELPEVFDDRCLDADYQVVSKSVGLDFTTVICVLLSGVRSGNRTRLI